jgi:RNase H-fold protein (predicted Holliday junction resolvase)
MEKNYKESPKVLGLDVSTKTIGIALFDISTKQLLELTHISPIVKEKDLPKMKELFLKSDVFKTKLEQYDGMNIQKVII